MKLTAACADSSLFKVCFTFFLCKLQVTRRWHWINVLVFFLFRMRISSSKSIYNIFIFHLNLFHCFPDNGCSFHLLLLLSLRIYVIKTIMCCFNFKREWIIKKNNCFRPWAIFFFFSCTVIHDQWQCHFYTLHSTPWMSLRFSIIIWLDFSVWYVCGMTSN